MIDYFDVARADALAKHVGIDGCAEHGDPSCLCDVVVETETPITDVPPLLFNFDGKDDFIRLAELLLGKQELVNEDRWRDAVKSYPDEYAVEWLWSTHHDPSITQGEVAQVLGTNKEQVRRMCVALGLEWVGAWGGRTPAHLERAKFRYLELRGLGIAPMTAMHQAEDECRVKLHKSTCGQWWSRHKAQVAA